MKADELFKRSPDEIAFEIQRGGRLVVYQYVVSIVILTFRRNSPVQFIPAGESVAAKSLPWTLLTFFLGWWGFPFGLIYTPMVLYKNLNGGTDITQAVAAKLGSPAA